MEKVLKKFSCTALSAILIFSGMPLQALGMGEESSYALEVSVEEGSLLPYESEEYELDSFAESGEPGEGLEPEVEELPIEAIPLQGGQLLASRQSLVPFEDAPLQLETDGVYSHRNWESEPDEEDFTPFSPASTSRHHFGAARSLGLPGADNKMSIQRVMVLDGGQYQARYRGAVGGHSVYQGTSGGWYTTARSASLMDGRVFTIQTLLSSEAIGDLSYEEFLASLSYSYGGLPLDAWLGGAQFNNFGSRFIHWQGDALLAGPEAGTYILESFIQFRSPYPAANPANINIPFTGYRGTNQTGFATAMRHVVGTFDLAIHGGEDQLGSLPIRLNLYDGFNLWEDVDQWALLLKDEAGAAQNVNGRHVAVSSLGLSPMGRDLWNIVIAQDQAAVEDYFARTRPRMTGSLEDLEALRSEVEQGVHHRIPLYFHNIHPDEVTGVCAQLAMVEQLLREDYLTFETVTPEQTHGLRTGALWNTPSPHPNGYVSIGRGPLASSDETTTVTISVEEALRYFIFIFVPTNNPDGHEQMLRSNSYGFDLNRDAAYQTQEENILVIQDVLKWSPLAMLEFHGHVAHLLIEPTTGPHNPNYEYDLLQPVMLEAAHIMGRAAISGAYDRYLIPAEHMRSGWDDGGPMYMPIFLMQFGILGFTLEIPHTNQDSLDANIAMGWAFLDHALENFDRLLLNKLEYQRRGITNADYAHLVDAFFTNPFTSPPTPLGRQRQEGLSFFPDYWVIPVDDFNQTNLLEAYRMLEYFQRHGVSIQRLAQHTVHDGLQFPEGTYVIDMRQARRGFVNTMMEAGYDASFFNSMYAEITMNFPALRGFQAKALWEADLFAGRVELVSHIQVPETTLPPGNSPYLSIWNNSQDAIRVVNALLGQGIPVKMAYNHFEQGNMGDFLVERSQLAASFLEGRFIQTRAVYELPEAVEGLIQPRIALLMATPHTQGTFSPARFILRDLGFEYVLATSNAMLGSLVPGRDFNLIVSHNQSFSNAWNFSNRDGIPFIGIQTTAATGAVSNLFANRGASSANITASREGTFLASYARSSMITNHVPFQSTAYLIGTTTFSQIPSGTVPLIQTLPGDFSDVFLGGWWQGAANQNNAPGRAVAFTGLSNAGVPATVFGSNIFNRAHAQAYHNLFGTAAFMHVSGIQDQARPSMILTSAFLEEGLLLDLEFIASETAGSEAYVTAGKFKISTQSHVPSFTEGAPGWQEFTEPVLHETPNGYLHWFAKNSYGIQAQGTILLGLEAPSQPEDLGVVATHIGSGNGFNQLSGTSITGMGQPARIGSLLNDTALSGLQIAPQDGSRVLIAEGVAPGTEIHIWINNHGNQWRLYEVVIHGDGQWAMPDAHRGIRIALP